MYDKKLVDEILTQIIEAVLIVQQRCLFVVNQDDFCDSKEGQEKLDGICMKLIAVGESLKNIDKITNRELLKKYPQIEWKKIKGIRDFISHHYFDIDAEFIFNICQTQIEPLLLTLKQIQKDLKEKNDKKI